jgi:amino acid transporter
VLLVDLLAFPNAAWNPGRLARHALPAVLLLGAGAVAGATSFVLYFSGFRRMATSSREFTNPAFLTLMGILGISLAAAGLVLFLAGVALTSSSYPLAPVAELFGVPFLFLGIILSVVGLFGQAVGSWKVGLRYQERSLRTGAVLMIVPMVGNALSFLGYRRALARGPPPASSTP